MPSRSGRHRSGALALDTARPPRLSGPIASTSILGSSTSGRFIALASASNAGIDNAAYANKKVLVVNGNSGDSLNLTGGQWVDTDAVTTFNLGGSFSIYQFGNSEIYVVTNLPPVTPP